MKTNTLAPGPSTDAYFDFLSVSMGDLNEPVQSPGCVIGTIPRERKVGLRNRKRKVDPINAREVDEFGRERI